MAQKRYEEYNTPIDSYSLGASKLGLLAPGCYSGFKEIKRTSALIFSLDIAIGAMDKAHPTLAYGAKATIITPGGVTIEEDSSITNLPFTVNGNANPRIDLIIVSHQLTAISGGQTATYSVLVGTPGVIPGAPALVNVDQDVVIGELFVPGLTSDIGSCTYIPHTPTGVGKTPWYSSAPTSYDPRAIGIWQELAPFALNNWDNDDFEIEYCIDHLGRLNFRGKLYVDINSVTGDIICKIPDSRILNMLNGYTGLLSFALSWHNKETQIFNGLANPGEEAITLLMQPGVGLIMGMGNYASTNTKLALFDFNLVPPINIMR